MAGERKTVTKDRRDIGQVVFLGETVEAAREISSCCVGVEAALESKTDFSGFLKQVFGRDGGGGKSEMSAYRPLVKAG